MGQCIRLSLWKHHCLSRCGRERHREHAVRRHRLGREAPRHPFRDALAQPQVPDADLHSRIEPQSLPVGRDVLALRGAVEEHGSDRVVVERLRPDFDAERIGG